MGHQLVHGAIGFDTPVVLGYTPAADKGGLALIASFGINA